MSKKGNDDLSIPWIPETVFFLMLRKEVKKIKVFVKESIKLFFELVISIGQQKITIVKDKLLILL